MLARCFKSRYRAFGCAHAFSDGVLRKTCPRTSFEHLPGYLVLQVQRVIRFGETLARTGFRQERLVIMTYRLVLQLSHLATP